MSTKNNNDENTFIRAYEELEGGPEEQGDKGSSYPLIEVLVGPNQGEWFSIQEAGDYTIGRAKLNEFSLKDNSVSRSHAVLRHDGSGHVTLRDIGSRNGTFVNQKKIQAETPLNHNDNIKVGIYTLRFLKHEDAETEVDSLENLALSGEDLTPKPSSVGDLKSEQVQEDQAVIKEVSEEQFTEEKTPQPELQEEPVPQPEARSEKKSADATPKVKKKSSLPLVLTLSVLLIFIVVIGIVGVKFKKEILALFQDSQTEKPENPIKDPVVIDPNKNAKSKGEINVVVEVDSLPVPAIIYYKGQELGRTPFKSNIKVKADELVKFKAVYQLELIGESLEGESSHRFKQEDDVVKLDFKAPVAQINVKNLPKRGDLYLEASFEKNQFQSKPLKLGQVSLDLPLYVPYGKFVAEIRETITLPGSSDQVPQVKYRREFSLNAQSNTYTMNVGEEELNQFPASISSDPSGAELWVSGQKLGETPWQGTLPLGRNKIVLKSEGFEDKIEAIDVNLNTPYSATFTMTGTSAGKYVLQGKQLLHSGRYNQAIESFIEALKRKPDPNEVSQIHLSLGDAFLKTKNFDQARSYFEKASKDDKLLLDASLGLAESYYGLGEPGQALVKITDALLNAKSEREKSQAISVYSKLYPKRSAIFISSTPKGATVNIQGNPIGQTTPVILSDLTAGKYRVKIEKDGYQAVEVRFILDVSSIKPLIVNLKELK